MGAVATLPKTLKELYLTKNKIRKIQGLEGFTSLRILELGSNRLRVAILMPFEMNCSFLKRAYAYTHKILALSLRGKGGEGHLVMVLVDKLTDRLSRMRGRL